MAEAASTDFVLREGSQEDLPRLADIDGSFSNEWVLHIGRAGDAIEQSITLGWRRLKPAGSTRDIGFDYEELLRQLTTSYASSRFVVAETGSRLAGYVMIGEQWNKTAELMTIIIDASYRRRGLGRRLVAEAEAFARERGLRGLQWEAQTDNRNAIEFAVSQGFRIAGFHDAFYSNDDLSRQGEADFRGVALFMARPV